MTDKERLTCLQVLPPGCAVGDYVQIDPGISSRDLLRLAQSYDGEIRRMVTRPGNQKCMYGRVEGTAFNNGSDLQLQLQVQQLAVRELGGPK